MSSGREIESSVESGIQRLVGVAILEGGLEQSQRRKYFRGVVDRLKKAAVLLQDPDPENIKSLKRVIGGMTNIETFPAITPIGDFLSDLEHTLMAGSVADSSVTISVDTYSRLSHITRRKTDFLWAPEDYAVSSSLRLLLIRLSSKVNNGAYFTLTTRFSDEQISVELQTDVLRAGWLPLQDRDMLYLRKRLALVDGSIEVSFVPDSGRFISRIGVPVSNNRLLLEHIGSSSYGVSKDFLGVLPVIADDSRKYRSRRCIHDSQLEMYPLMGKLPGSREELKAKITQMQGQIADFFAEKIDLAPVNDEPAAKTAFSALAQQRIERLLSSIWIDKGDIAEFREKLITKFSLADIRELFAALRDGKDVQWLFEAILKEKGVVLPWTKEDFEKTKGLRN